MDLPAHVQAALGIGSPVTEDELAAAVDAWPPTQAAFGLSGKEFTTAAIDAAAGGFTFTVSRPNRFPHGWKYIEISSGGSLECVAVITPELAAGMPPTAAGQVLVKAWFSDPSVVDKMAIPAGLLVRGMATGLILGAFASNLVTSWAEVCPLLEGTATCPSWVSKSQLGIDANARLTDTHISNLKYQGLLLEAISELKVKWRFLSLYRLLEHGYLSEVFQTLNSSFFSSPKESLEAALKSIASEIKQFLALAEVATLQAQFEMLYDEFQKNKVAGNKFAIALDRSMQQTNQMGQVNGKWQTGVLICYKVRCAIVHAGLSAPIYDAYADGPVLVEALLPICESIALTFLGVSIL